VATKYASLLAVLSLTSAVAFAEDDKHNGHLGPGCDPDRPAVAHHAGGNIVKEPHGKNHQAPIPCSTSTGWRTGELSIAVSNRGTVLYQSVLPSSGLPIGLLRSVDRGESWDFVNPTVTPARMERNDQNLFVDRDTGRIFWSSDLVGLLTFGIPSRPGTDVYIDHSDDDGKTWSRSAPLPMFFDHTQVFTGPPPRNLKQLQQGYPNVVYVAVSGGFTCFVFNFCGTHVAKSLDGGKTFEQPVALPFPPECPLPGSNPTGGYGLNGVVSRDGTVYLPFTPCERPYVAISHDEGATWELSLVADTQTVGWGELGLGMDKNENFYAAWTDLRDRLPYLAISRDGAQHWETPLMIAAPGVNETAEPQLVSGKRGQVAVAYYGSKNSPGIPIPEACSGAVSTQCPGFEHETWNTYITESWDALSKNPVFWSAPLNDPRNPTWYGLTPSAMRISTPTGIQYVEGGVGFPGFTANIDYFGMTMAPDDTAWVAFDQECVLGQNLFAGNPNCSFAAGGIHDGLFGLAGRLVRAQGKDEDDD
jgi:hypothetical protein